MLKNPARVNGGFGDVADHRLDRVQRRQDADLLNGECTFSRQAANFDSNFKDKVIGPDGDINAFYFPPANDKFGNPSWVVAPSPRPSPTVPRCRRSCTS